ncbi:hypothetical protein [Intestinibacillus massiliensis]
MEYNEELTQDVGVNVTETPVEAGDAIPPTGEIDTVQPEADGAQPVGHREQTPEENAQFAAARRRAEAEFNQRLQAEQDKLIAQVYAGQVNPYTGRPITNKAEYDAFIEQHQQEEQRQQYEQAGIDPDMLNQLIAQNPTVQQAQQVIEQAQIAEGKRALESQVAEIGKIDPSIKSLADIIAMPTFQEFDTKVRQGYSIADAFRLANFDTLGKKRSAAAKQAALNAMNGKSHLTATTGGAGEDVIVPQETMDFYRQAFPGWTDAQIMADYKKHQ